MYRYLLENDSSKPCFLIKNSQPVLVMLWTFGKYAPGAGVAVQHYIDLPNPPVGVTNLVTKIAQYRAGNTGSVPSDDGVPENWQLNLETFSDFPAF